MSDNKLSLGEFWLGKIAFSDEEWVIVGKITVIAGYIENTMKDIPSYILNGYSGTSHWKFEKRPSWERLRDSIKDAAKNGDIAPLDTQFLMAAGEAHAALRRRGQIAHSVLLENGNGGHYLYRADINNGDIKESSEPISIEDLRDTLDALVKAYDRLESCKTGLAFARGMRGSPPNESAVRLAAIALKERGNVPHSRTR